MSLDLNLIVGTFVGVVVTLLCTYIAIRWTKRSSQDHEKSAGQRHDDLKKEMSTKHIGVFPDYLADISELVDSANHKVQVMCTYPQHGAYSNPASWKKIYVSIIKAVFEKELDVEMVFSSSDQRLFADTRQFAEAFDDWGPWFSGNRHKLVDYVNCHGDVPTRRNHEPRAHSNDCDIEDAYEWLWFQDNSEKAVAKDWFNRNSRVSIRESPHLMPLFVWIVDNKTAIFVVMTYDERSLGHAFQTSQRDVIDALQQLVCRYKDDSDEFDFTFREFDEVKSVIESYQATPFFNSKSPKPQTATDPEPA